MPVRYLVLPCLLLLGLYEVGSVPGAETQRGQTGPGEQAAPRFQAAAGAGSVLLFSYFRGNGEDGLHLASSRDGYRWSALNRDRSFLAPQVGGKLMRDPCLLQGPDGVFHMVWTTGWGDRVIGYASSRDLVHWSPQQAIPVMMHEPSARNAWAPELFYDEDEKRFLIFWASTIPGRFPETDRTGDEGWNHRIYATTTRDFKTFTSTRLFFDGGFNMIDATILKARGEYLLIIKDETKTPVKKNLRIARSAKAEGPYRQVSGPISTSWVEGPSAIQVGEEFLIYFDHYATPQYYGAIRSRGLLHWEDVSSKVEFPKGARHGTVLRVPEETIARLSSSAKRFHPGKPWLDDHGVPINAHGGGILVHEGTFYWFGQHMVEGEAGNYAQVGVHAYSSKNLYDWKDEGIALRVSDDPKSDIAKGCILERPKVTYSPKTGKFVMWFHLELKGNGYGAARSGVAVADRPTGPYRFQESFRPNAGVWPNDVPEELKKPLTADEAAHLRTFHLGGGPVPNYPENLIFRRDFAGGQMARDMTLFVDDDGTAYHVYASEDNGTLHISQLSDDYQRPAGKYVRVLPGGFNEAPAIFKHGGKYYLITSGCTGWVPNAARLAVADSIWGPWKARGNPCVGKDANLTFHGQATYVLPLPSNPGALIFMADRWQRKNAIDGRHLWLPVQFKGGKPLIEWIDHWDLSFFDGSGKRTR